MDVKERELQFWNDLLEHEARRECATEHWAGELAGHAMALGRLGVIDKEKLGEMLELADSAFSHVAEELLTREWLQAQAAEKLEKGEG
jgi:hypothetical protein